MHIPFGCTHFLLHVQNCQQCFCFFSSILGICLLKKEEEKKGSLKTHCLWGFIAVVNFIHPLIAAFIFFQFLLELCLVSTYFPTAKVLFDLELLGLEHCM